MPERDDRFRTRRMRDWLAFREREERDLERHRLWQAAAEGGPRREREERSLADTAGPTAPPPRPVLPGAPPRDRSQLDRGVVFEMLKRRYGAGDDFLEEQLTALGADLSALVRLLG
jgi:hypothetical protein